MATWLQGVLWFASCLIQGAIVGWLVVWKIRRGSHG